MTKPPKAANSECVKVIVRCRPMNDKEIAEKYGRVVELHPSKGVVEIQNQKNGTGESLKQFTFDAVYDGNAKQQELYDETFRPLVDSVLNGFNGTIFAYGQTGTGKTYTMEGMMQKLCIKNDTERRGVIPNSFDHIYSYIARSENRQFLVRASYLEIYQEELRDLLIKDQKQVSLELKESPDAGVMVKGLSTYVCKSVKEIENVMKVGNQNRAVGSTNMNEHSSRSHAIFMITVESCERITDGKSHIRVGKLNLVDLAGSERQAKTGTVGERLKEATKINLSLSALGNVISALVDGKSSHIPYRDSKLTRLLQDSLGGNAKTVMVANIGPASYNYDETLTTLRYANRAKNIKNKPRVNEDPKDALLREYQQELLRLKSELVSKTGKRRRRKKGNEIGDNEQIEDETDGLTEEEYLKEQQSRLEEEKKAIINDQNMIAEEKDALLGKMDKKQEQIKKQQDQMMQLQHRIQSMEGKLLSGGKNIIDHTNEQQRALEQRRQEIAEQKRREREIEQTLEQQEESALEIQGNFSSLQQEVEIKTRKLKKLFSKLQQVKQEIQDLQQEHTRERHDLQQTQNELTRELKLKYLVIENFIPQEERNKLQSRAVYDDDDDQWKLLPLSKLSGTQQSNKRPISASGSRRPVSEYAKMAAAMGGNPRYKAENILAVELDMPQRTTKDYQGPLVAPRVKAVLDAALKDDEDMDIDASLGSLPSDFKIRSSRKEKTSKERVKSAKHPPGFTPDNINHYPESRGLVPK